jgi:tetratricopeptide (TPR) repeat protein
MRRAVELDPLSSINNIALAQMLYLEGRPDESAEYCNKVIEVDSSFAPAHKYLGLDYQQKQMYPESLDQMRVWAATPQDDIDSIETFGALYAAAGAKRRLSGAWRD